MKVRPAKRVAVTEEYYFSRKLKEIAAMKAAGHEVLNLGIGNPDQAPATAAIQQLGIESQNPKQHGYQSYIGLPLLRKAFADWYARFFAVKLNPEKEVLPLIGSKEGIMHITMSFLDPGDQVLVPNPGYPAYRATAQLAGAEIIEYALSEANGWLPDLTALAQLDLRKVKIMWVNYPHMPTGAPASKAFFEKLIAFAKEQEILVVNDNPYSFILNDQQLSLLSVDGAKEVALELNSLSKSHNMAGWRIGMLAGDAEYLQYVLRFKSNMDSGMFLPLQMAAVEALKQGEDWYEKLNAVYHKRRIIAYQLMDLLNCKYQSGQPGMFVWAKIPTDWKDAFALSDHLLEEAKVFITPGGIFGSQGDQYLRISLCSDIAILQKAMARIEKIILQKER